MKSPTKDFRLKFKSHLCQVHIYSVDFGNVLSYTYIFRIRMNERDPIRLLNKRYIHHRHKHTHSHTFTRAYLYNYLYRFTIDVVRFIQIVRMQISLINVSKCVALCRTQYKGKCKHVFSHFFAMFLCVFCASCVTQQLPTEILCTRTCVPLQNMYT